MIASIHSVSNLSFINHAIIPHYAIQVTEGAVKKSHKKLTQLQTDHRQVPVYAGQYNTGYGDYRHIHASNRIRTRHAVPKRSGPLISMLPVLSMLKANLTNKMWVDQWNLD